MGGEPSAGQRERPAPRRKLARVVAWLDRAVTDDPILQRNARAVQIACFALGALLALAAVGNLIRSAGALTPAICIEVVIGGLAFLTVFLVRRYSFALGIGLFVTVTMLAGFVMMARTGFVYNRDGVKMMAIPMTLAAFMLGRRGLRVAAGILFAAVVVSGMRDAGYFGDHPAMQPTGTPASMAITTAAWVFTLGMLLDRFGVALREALAVALERARHLELRAGELRVEIERRERIEAQLVEAGKLEAIGRLAGGVAHDFNNLLTAMLSFAELAKGSLPENTPARADMDEVIIAAERASALTRQLLAFARQQVVEARCFAVDELVSGLEPMLRRVLRENIVLVVDPRARASLRMDPSQLEQVIVNLVVNARDAMPQGGRIAVETSTTLVSLHDSVADGGLAPGEYVVLTVTDTGDGIPRELLGKIFEPFFTTKGRGEGTGLGLATCYGIAQQAGGALFVRSTVGLGSTFRVFLPRDAAEADSIVLPASEENRARGGSELLLLVEDEAQLRSLASRTLTALGYTVLSAASAEEAQAIARAESRTIAALVTDVVLPHRSGRELAQALRDQRPDLRVLFVSGYHQEEALKPGALGSHAAFLPKPYTPTQLAKAVRTVLDQASTSRPRLSLRSRHLA